MHLMVLYCIVIHKVYDEMIIFISLTFSYTGGLVCRGLLELYPDHNVHTFISLSAPLMGQYGCKLKSMIF